MCVFNDVHIDFSLVHLFVNSMDLITSNVAYWNLSFKFTVSSLRPHLVRAQLDPSARPDLGRACLDSCLRPHLVRPHLDSNLRQHLVRAHLSKASPVTATQGLR